MRVLYIYGVSRYRRMYLHDPGLLQFDTHNGGKHTVVCVNGKLQSNRLRALIDAKADKFYDVTVLHGYQAYKPVSLVKRHKKKALGLVVFVPSNDSPWFKARNQEAVAKLAPEIILPEQHVRLSWYKKKAKLYAEWFPPACCTDVFKPNGNEFTHDIAFAGTMARASKYGKRNEWIRTLSKDFKTLIRSGITQQEFNAVYNAGRVSFHMSQFFSEGKKSEGTAYRVFEVGGIGRGVLMSDKNPDIERLFTPDRHYLDYGGAHPWQELVSKIKWLLDNPKQADEIARRMQDLILSRHTYEIRGKRLMEIVSKYV